MKLKQLVEGKVTSIADARGKREQAKDAQTFAEIAALVDNDPNAFVQPTFPGSPTTPTKKDFPRKIAIQVLEQSVPEQLKVQLNGAVFNVQRRMSNGTKVMDITATIQVKGFQPKEIFDVHPLAGKVFKRSVMALVKEMGTLVEKGQFATDTSATLILR